MGGPLGLVPGPLVESWWHLNHFGVEALSHFCPTVGQKNRTIRVDVNQSSSLENRARHEVRTRRLDAFMLGRTLCSDLVEEDGGEGDAKLCWDHGEASFGPAVLPDSRNSISCTFFLLFLSTVNGKFTLHCFLLFLFTCCRCRWQLGVPRI